MYEVLLKLTCFIFEPNIVFLFCISLVITPDVTDLFVCQHWWAMVKKMGSQWEKKKYFYLQLSRKLLEWCYSLHQMAVCIYKIYFLFKSVYFWAKTFDFSLGVGFLGWRLTLPLVLWPHRRDTAGGSRAMCSVWFYFCLIAFIYW